MMYLKCDKCNREQNLTMLRCDCETEQMKTLDLKEARRHYNQLSPHVKERDTAEYLRLALERIRELEETEKTNCVTRNERQNT
jgi:hypothetical protein